MTQAEAQAEAVREGNELAIAIYKRINGGAYYDPCAGLEIKRMAQDIADHIFNAWQAGVRESAEKVVIAIEGKCDSCEHDRDSSGEYCNACMNNDRYKEDGFHMTQRVHQDILALLPTSKPSTSPTDQGGKG